MTDYIAFYGSLMERANDPAAPSRTGLSRYISPCRIAGVLRDHGAYPGFFPPDNAPRGSVQSEIVKAELHELVGPEAFEIFDRYENYDPRNEAASLYVRRRIRLLAPEIEAWVYVSQLSPMDPRVPGDDWAAFRGGCL
ncbi:hypothetical protein FP2506_07776 [Fulvimarina pelagi HTCC2506]|uniref:Gamma-glutamylcyclotransferase AIG2-like domain-containing protein n=1 Tax=Fulvimarina pelagi HTCC2506 TaxID=314231 RepID=Q0G6J1_9HYPH|nr:gamma-glutamylcyclotransferase family protein [Fulvimarina pelagi]EAU42723.1 hypothetical protein FP2506_07776 [Fulvimarina pelagi HTCC2506]